MDRTPLTREWRPAALDIQGHRGARALAPESTAESFQAAFDAGVTGVEFDVRLTADGQVVVWHDPTLQADKCLFLDTDLTEARVNDLTLEQLRTVDIGSRTLTAYPAQVAAPGARIMTFAELLERFARDHPTMWWTVELKCDPTDPREVATRHELTATVIETINDFGVGDRAFVHSFDWAVLELARELDPTLLRSALAVPGVTYAAGSPWIGSLTYEEFGDDLPAAAAALGAVVVSPFHEAVTPEFVARAHQLDVKVLPWTVNTDAEVSSVVAAGVDGLVTDDPVSARVSATRHT